MKPIKLGISPCPNDTYIFGAILRKDVEFPLEFETVTEDVQYLNRMAMENLLDIVKVSFGVYPEIAGNYKILKAGGAMGFGCGPLLLSRKYSSGKELEDKKIAVPGLNTTAYMIFKRFFPECLSHIVEMRFDKIMPAVADGECDAGLVIHEGRFVYKNYGLNKIADLGNLWEEKLHCPIPLGFIAVKKDIARYAQAINNSIRASIGYADSHNEEAYRFAEKYAWDMDEKVMRSHVLLYVNEYSLDITHGKNSVSALLGTDDSVFA